MNSSEKKELDEALFQDLSHFIYNYGHKKGYKTDTTISLPETLQIGLNLENGYFRDYMKYDFKKFCVYSIKTSRKLASFENMQKVYLMGVENGINKKGREFVEPEAAGTLVAARASMPVPAANIIPGPTGVVIKSLAIPFRESKETPKSPSASAAEVFFI